MSLPTKVNMQLSQRELAKISRKSFLEMWENLAFLVQLPPLPIDERFKDRKVNYHHREIFISIGFKSVPVTRKMERKNRWKRGLYDSTSIPANFLTYAVMDLGDVERYGNPPGCTIIGSVGYEEKELRKLKKQPVL